MVKQIIKHTSTASKKTLLLITLFFLIGTLFISTGLLVWQKYYNKNTISIYEKKLSENANKKWSEILACLQQQEQNAITLSLNHAINPAIDFFSHKKSDELFIKNFLLFMSSQQELFGFKNCILLNTTGSIIFSTKQNTSLEETNFSKKNKKSSLHESFERAIMTTTNDFSEFSFDEHLNEPALFITIPLYQKKKFIGALAYQVDEKKIYSIINNYTDLGKTGEIVLAKQQDSSHLIFVFPSRHDPDLAFKKREFFPKTNLSIKASILGGKGTGIAIDYRGKPVIAAWTFIPKLDWGMVVKIDQEEILYSKQNQQILFFILILILIALLGTILQLPKIKKFLAPSSIKFRKKVPLFLFVMCLFLSIKNIIQTHITTSSTLEQNKTEIMDNVHSSTDDIEKILNSIVFTALSIGDDLHTERLTKNDIKIRIKRDLTENENLTAITIAFAPHAYNEEKKLYAPSITKAEDSFTEEMIEDSYDYTDVSAGIVKTAWYLKAVENGQVWQKPYKNNKTKIFTGTYSRAFFNKQKQLLGVVSLSYKLNNIIATADDIPLGKTGYSLIMAEDGELIFYPTNESIYSHKTLLQFAQEIGDEKLATVAKKILDKKSQISSFLSKSTNRLTCLYTNPITVNGWILGALFPEDEIGLDSLTIRHYHFWTLFYITLTLLFLLIFFNTAKILSVIQCIIIITATLTLALITSWIIIKKTATLDTKTKTVITDQLSLDKFINTLDDEAQRKHEAPPINIPCGIILYSLNIADPEHINISGYIWNKYNNILHKNVSRGVQVPQATALRFTEPIKSTTEDWQTVNWNIQGTIFEEQNYTEFPFDKQHFKIMFEHRDIEKNIILTPDLTAYKKLSPETTPGLDTQFKLSGFTIEQTFFDYDNISPDTNFGFNNYDTVTNSYRLAYNIILNRNLLNPFILYFIPLLVILFSLFSTLLVSERTTSPFTILGPYTGLFFGLIVLQRSLRESYPTGSTLYLEYAFFYTYITIIMLILHALLAHYYTRWYSYHKKIFSLIKFLFWPIQLASWLITTLIIFY